MLATGQSPVKTLVSGGNNFPFWYLKILTQKNQIQFPRGWKEQWKVSSVFIRTTALISTRISAFWNFHESHHLTSHVIRPSLKWKYTLSRLDTPIYGQLLPMYYPCISYVFYFTFIDNHFNCLLHSLFGLMEFFTMPNPIFPTCILDLIFFEFWSPGSWFFY